MARRQPRALFAFTQVAAGQFFPLPQPDPSCTGTAANDVMFVGEGDDVFSEAGEDCLIMGKGNDTGNGSEGLDP